MHLLLNQTPPPLPANISTQLSRAFVSNIYICYMRCPGANVRRHYLHSKYTSPPHLPYPAYPLLSIKGDENGKSDGTTVCAWVKYVIVEILRLISRGLNNVLLKGVPVSSCVPRRSVFRMQIMPPDTDICSGASHMAYIYIRHKNPAQLCGNMCGGLI